MADLVSLSSEGIAFKWAFYIIFSGADHADPSRLMAGSLGLEEGKIN